MGIENKIRSFIAIELREDAKKIVAKTIESLKTVPVNVRYVKPEAMHLTLRFLGEISGTIIEKLAKLLSPDIQKYEPFNLSLAQLGTFGGRIPKVIWIGLDGEIENAQKIYRSIESTCISCGLPPDDKPFSPHITIGRVKSPTNCEQLVQKIKTVTIEPLTIPVDRIVLFKSKLTPEGPIYTPLHVFSLGGKKSS